MTGPVLIAVRRPSRRVATLARALVATGSVVIAVRRPSRRVATLALAALAVVAAGLTVAPAQAAEPAASCPNEAVRVEQRSTFLPDCRAYELVSPPDKNGTGVVSDSQRTRAAADGDALQFLSLGAFGDAIGTGIATDYIAERTGTLGTTGWATHAITPLQSGSTYDELATVEFEPRYEGEFSSGLSTGVFFADSPLTNDSSTASVPNLYRRTNLLSAGPGSYELVTHCPACEASGTPLPPPSIATGVAATPMLAWTSPDAGRGVFESGLKLTGDTPSFGNRVEAYEWNGSTVALAGRVPKSGAASCDDLHGPACLASPYSLAGQGAQPPGLSNADHINRTPDVMSDGSDGHTRVFFTFPTANGTTANPASDEGQLYMRVDGSSTVKLNVSERSTPVAFAPALFLDASKDGERVFFMSTQALTDDAEGPGEHIYMYDTTQPEGHRLTLINADHEPADGTSSIGVGIVGLSNDGSYVYFVTGGQIVRGEPPLGGTDGLYLWHDGTVSYITSVPNSLLEELLTTGGNFAHAPRQSRVSPDGRWLLYREETGTTQQLYFFSADTGAAPVCVSCDPSGGSTSGDATDQVRTDSGATATSWSENHALADDGSRVFFSTAAALVPQDVNEKEDVYEYDVASGSVRLISSGTGTADSWFMDASADGSDVFFTTSQQLTGWDRDEAYDVYDARVDGGLPEPPQGSVCEGELCQGALAGSPLLSPVLSDAFSGAGNIVPGVSKAKVAPKLSCKRGFVRKRVKGRERCVKKGKGKQSRPRVKARRAQIAAQAPSSSRAPASVPPVGVLASPAHLPGTAAGAPQAAPPVMPSLAASPQAASGVSGPAWSIDSLANTTVAPGGELEYLVTIRNVGTEEANGEPVVVRAVLPAGMTVVSASLLSDGTGTPYPCANGGDPETVLCSDSEQVKARQGSGSLQKLRLNVRVEPSASGVLTASFSVSGGGAAVGASTVDPTVVSASLPGFGVDAFDGLFGDAGGVADGQAGGHPGVASVALDFNTLTNASPFVRSAWPVEPVKDVLTDLPAGFVGNPTVLDRCTMPQLLNNNGQFDPRPLCPASSQVGTTVARFKGGGQGLGGQNAIGPLPVFDMVPPPGVPAAFAFNVIGSIVVLDARVRTGGDYGVTVDARNIPEGLAIVGTNVSFWGVPADPSHDGERACPGNEPPVNGGPSCSNGGPLRAFLRMPTSCTAPGVGLPVTTRLDSWAHPGVFQESTWVTHEPPGYPYPPEDWGPQVGISGCDRVPFTPSFSAQPEPAQAGGPAGLAFDLSLPQSDDPSSTGEADLKTAAVTLPAGVRINPSGAGGLTGCTPAQIALDQPSEPECPESSRIGSVTIETPLLKDPVKGGVYLASPHENPSNSLVALYLTASADGVVIKLPGSVSLDPGTGQVTTTFEDNPQLPFSHLHLQLKGGPRAPLSLPDRCGTYTTHAQLAGWNGATVGLDSSFTLAQDEHGQPCPAAFSPSFSAGTTSNRAGASSTFDLRFARGDDDQELAGVTLNLPAGLTGKIAGVPQCPDALAASGGCPESSRIGSVTTGAGAGSNPFFITTGKAYLTGPYRGAPFGVAIVVPAVAGPFDLGNVVVRSALFIDPETADVRIVSDPLPTILQGIPLDDRDVRVTVDRPGFMVNPTSCDPLAITGTLTSTVGSTAPVSDRFQAADCASLKFHPRFSASTAASSELKRHGASLDVKISTHQGPGRGEANIAKVEVALPKVLPSRLTTLQKACTEKQFATNPAGCPKEAMVGTATAHTPLLNNPVTGPAYLVSHGNEAFPDLVIVLSGEGITLQVTGHTQIKHGVTYSRFETVPDDPITSFELNLPQGNYSALAAISPPCGRTVVKHHKRTHVATNLDMPTTITAQNGAVLRQTTKIAVTGCPRAKR